MGKMLIVLAGTFGIGLIAMGYYGEAAAGIAAFLIVLDAGVAWLQANQS